MKHFSLGSKLPYFISKRLFGDRKNFGLEKIENDDEWKEWVKFYFQFYNNTQKNGLGEVVNNAGYVILNKVDFNGKDVVEIGPGTLPHVPWWSGNPNSYSLIDLKEEFLVSSKMTLEDMNIKNFCYKNEGNKLPLPDHSCDIIVSFYSLEHLNPLENYIAEFNRILRPNGLLVGAIPTEGGIGWGMGRYLTSRRYLKKHTRINPDKIICWEHPNFAEHILNRLNDSFTKVSISYWPLRVPNIDANLVIKFIFKKK